MAAYSPGIYFAGTMCAIGVMALAGRLLIFLRDISSDVIDRHLREVVEVEYPNCRATWHRSGMLLTSKETGATVTEISMTTVRAVLSKNNGVLSRLGMRFHERFKGEFVNG